MSKIIVDQIEGLSSQLVTFNSGISVTGLDASGSVLIDNIPITRGLVKTVGSNLGDSIFIGKDLFPNEDPSQSGKNVFVGHNIGAYLSFFPPTAVFNNVFLGHSVADGIDSYSTDCIGIGRDAFKRATEGSVKSIRKSVAIGSYALGDFQSTTSSTISGCIGIGEASLNGRNHNINNIGIGLGAGSRPVWQPEDTNVTNSIFIGTEAGSNSVDCTFTVSIGSQANYFSTANTDGIYIGGLAGESGSTNSFAIAIGNQAAAVQQNSTDVISIGQSAGSNTYNNANSVFIGKQAGFIASNCTGSIGIGENVLGGNVNDSHSIAIGSFAGSGFVNHDSTVRNISIGYAAGQDLFVVEDCVFIGSNVAQNKTNIQNSMALGNQADPTASNQITLGNTSITSLRCNVTTISSLSDARDKSNVEDMPLGLDFVNALRPVKFDWSRRDGSMQGVKEVGFIAQELDAVQSQFACEEYLKMVDKTDADRLEASYAQLVPVLVKAIQELKLEVESLKNA